MHTLNVPGVAVGAICSSCQWVDAATACCCRKKASTPANKPRCNGCDSKQLYQHHTMCHPGRPSYLKNPSACCKSLSACFRAALAIGPDPRIRGLAIRGGHSTQAGIHISAPMPRAWTVAQLDDSSLNARTTAYPAGSSQLPQDSWTPVLGLNGGSDPDPDPSSTPYAVCFQGCA